MLETYVEHEHGPLKTGDLLLFSGATNFSSGIKWFTISRWSHIAMILRLPRHRIPLVWESNRLPTVPDALDGSLKAGVQVTPMNQRLTTYPGLVAVRQLNRAVTRDMKRAVMELRELVQDHPYERSMLEIVRSAWDGPLGKNRTEDLSSVFCSELIAEAYQRMGLLPCDTEGGAPSNEYTPHDFSAEGLVELLGEWQLGPELILKRDDG